jgi:FOG: Ankyrin repeat
MNLQNNRGEFPLLLAVRKNNVTVVNFLLANGADPNLISKNETTVLCQALRSESDTLARFLLGKGADPNSMNQTGDPAILFAVHSPWSSLVRVDIMNMLLKRGANPDSKDHDGQTVLIEAIQRREPSMVRLLPEYGANVYLPNERGETPLSTAKKVAKNRSDEVLYLLHRYKAQ